MPMGSILGLCGRRKTREREREMEEEEQRKYGRGGSGLRVICMIQWVGRFGCGFRKGERIGIENFGKQVF